MMFEGEYYRALHNLVDNIIITPEILETPKHVLNPMQTTIREDEHFWHLRDEIVSDIRQKPNETIHTLSN